MAPDPHQVERVFHEAMRLEGRERTQFLDTACERDPGLRKAVERLIAANDRAGSFLPDKESETKDFEQPGASFDNLTLFEKIGEGAFATVWVAEQAEPVRRRVALKILKPGMDSREIVTRFEAERQALAMMEHPNIASVYDAGTTPQGRPYFIMELVRGVPINEFCDQNALPTEERLQLFMKVCRAVQHAHLKGVIHRDLKPSNILVTQQDGEAVPKVIDFGIAKALGVRLTEKTLYTGFFKLAGTPIYMSPEQSEMSAVDVDTRSDIYSLGVILYELLTGCTPIDQEELKRIALYELLKVIREREPARPSAMFSTLGEEQRTVVASRRGVSPRHLMGFLRGDLDWIVIKALEKNRNRRYESAGGLAEDIERHLTHEPVSARAPGKAYLARKFVRRHRTGVAFAGIIALAVVTVLVVSSVMYVRERVARDRAERAESLQASLRVQAEESAAEAKASRAVSERLLYASDMSLAGRALAENNIGKVRMLLDRHRPGPGEADLRGWEWRYLWEQVRQKEGIVLVQREARVQRVDFSPDNRHLVIGFWDGSVELWDWKERRLVEVIEPSRNEEILGMGVFSPDGRYLVTTGEIGEVKRHDLASGAVKILWTVPRAMIRDLSFSPDSRHVGVIARDLDNSTRTPPGGLVHVETGEVLAQEPIFGFDNHFGVGRFSRDGDRYFFGANYYHYGRLKAMTVPDWEMAWEIELTDDRGYSAVAVSHDNKLLATGTGYNGTAIRIWMTDTGRYQRHLEGHTGWVAGLAFSPDDSLLASAGADHVVRLWETRSWAEIATLRGHGEALQTVAFSPDGTMLASGDKVGQVMLWPLAEAYTRAAFQDLPPDGRTGDFLPGSRVILADTMERDWFLYDVDSGRRTDLSLESARRISRDALMAWSGKSPEQVSVVRVKPEGIEILAKLEVETGLQDQAALSPDHQLFAWTTKNGPVRLVRLTDPQLMSVLTGAPPDAVPMEFSHDGKVLIALSRNEQVLSLWDTGSGEHLGNFPVNPHQWPYMWSTHAESPLLANLVPDGPYTRVDLRDFRDAAAPPVSLNPGQWILEHARSPDGRTLALGTPNGTLFFYDLPTRALLERWDGINLAIFGIAFFSDGKRLISTADNAIGGILWDLETGSELLRLDTSNVAGDVVVSDDGTCIMAYSTLQRGHLRVWTAPRWETIDAIEAEGAPW